ncbi:hypothetical protein OHS58_17725 [Amycolatopsis sp. NBC_00348]|uniref:hypothetical protein n=1 Tax=Amycolatopsis sp. NBC_00348 TaxID=2975956 RepID=UPI002E25247B
MASVTSAQKTRSPSTASVALPAVHGQQGTTRFDIGSVVRRGLPGFGERASAPRHPLGQHLQVFGEVLRPLWADLADPVATEVR